MTSIKTGLKVIFILCVMAGFASLAFGQIEWTKHVDNPILEIGDFDEWDCNGAGLTSVIYDGGIYKGWYIGIDSYGTSRIGYATSQDGITWVKNVPHYPVFSPGEPGAWDGDNVNHACVVKVDDLYRMWYTGEGNGHNQIGCAYSYDGVHWARNLGNNPVLSLGAPGSWEESEVMHSTVILLDGTYHMWYNGYGQNLQRTGHATSTDGFVWTRDPANPVITMGESGLWDDYMLVMMAVVHRNNQFKMWYSAGDGTNEDNWYFRVGYATSPDGTTWTKYGTQPVLDVGETFDWDYLGVVTSSVIYDSPANTYKMWFAGFDGEYIRSGYAFSVATGINDEKESLPDDFALYQNYPNPFNASTTISYRLPQASQVKLAIYDILGQKVAVFNERRQAAGNHEFIWDAASLPSGIYFCRMEAEDYSQTQKMLLLK